MIPSFTPANAWFAAGLFTGVLVRISGSCHGRGACNARPHHV